MGTTTTMARSPAAIAGAVCTCCMCTLLIIGCGFPGLYVIEVDSQGQSVSIGFGLWGVYLSEPESSDYESRDCGDGDAGTKCITMRALYVLAVLLSFLSFLASAGGIANKTANFGAACMNFTAAVFCVAAGGYIRNQWGDLSAIQEFRITVNNQTYTGDAGYSFTYAAAWCGFCLHFICGIISVVAAVTWKDDDCCNEGGEVHGAATAKV